MPMAQADKMWATFTTEAGILAASSEWRTGPGAIYLDT